MESEAFCGVRQLALLYSVVSLLPLCELRGRECCLFC